MSNTVSALPPLRYHHEARVLPKYKYTFKDEPHDGDTFYALIRMAFRTLTEVNIRLYGLNCPELKNKDGSVNPLGSAAKQFTWGWLEEAGLWVGNEYPLEIDSLSYVPDDKYGTRADCRVYRKTDGKELGNDLIMAGHAVFFKG